jgi:RNA polymerase sigma-70 factor (ECF subfamily)
LIGLFCVLTDASSYFFFFAAAFFFGAAFFLVAFFIVDSPNRNLRFKKSQRDSYIELLEKKVKQKMNLRSILREDRERRTPACDIQKPLRDVTMSVKRSTTTHTKRIAARAIAPVLYRNAPHSRYPHRSSCSTHIIDRMIFPGLILALELGGQHDEELARRLQRRDPDAMKDLYDRFGRLAYSVVFAIVRDASTAEDLVQETFLRVWNRIQAFEPGRGALGPWLLAIARNRAIDHIRSSASRIDRNAFELDVREHPSLFVDMEREVMNTDHARLIRSAMAKLTPKQRKVIELAYYEGLSQTEMAERMGEPLGTVKTWVRMALGILREELGQAVAA